jgi:Ser/Thr protein kinase RdoA (MazF antagonist)
MLTNPGSAAQMAWIMVNECTNARAVLTEYGLDDARVSPLGKGLINQTWLVEKVDDQRFVLQRVNPIFPPAINQDIDAVTRRLVAKDLLTTRLVPTSRGGLWVDRQNEVWRLLTYVDGESHDFLTSENQAREAGKLLARFHCAVGDMDHHFANLRLGIHDTARHLQFLQRTLNSGTAHPQHAAAAKLGQEIFELAKTLPELPKIMDRIVHGDPKINNILFERGTDKALCLIDLDTISRMPLPLELGDAMRSWCNRSGEDERGGEFSSELFAASIEGYAEEARGWITLDEWSVIVPATEIILVELAARFCADALNESYFDWDSDRFGSLSEHNIVRAAGQLSVVRSLAAKKSELQKIVHEFSASITAPR